MCRKAIGWGGILPIITTLKGNFKVEVPHDGTFRLQFIRDPVGESHPVSMALQEKKNNESAAEVPVQKEEFNLQGSDVKPNLGSSG